MYVAKTKAYREADQGFLQIPSQLIKITDIITST